MVHPLVKSFDRRGPKPSADDGGDIDHVLILVWQGECGSVPDLTSYPSNFTLPREPSHLSQ
jgi:hypothetical protein